MKQCLLVILSIGIWFPAMAQSNSMDANISATDKELLNFKSTLPDKETIVSLDSHTAFASSTLLYQPRQQMDFSYIKYAVAWPSLDKPTGSAPDGYSRAHFTHAGYQTLSGFNVYSVMNLDFKSIGKGASVFSSHAFSPQSRYDIGGNFFDFKNRKVFFLSTVQAQ